MSDELALLQLIVLAMIIGTILHPAFFTQINLVNILQQSSELSVLVFAEAIILIVGKFDLSLESIVGVAPMVAAWLVLGTALNGSGLDAQSLSGDAARSSPSASPSATFNGFLIVRLGLNAFITTLAMLILLRGVAIGMTNGRTLYDLPGAAALSRQCALARPARVRLGVGAALPRRRLHPRAITASAARSTRSAATPRRRAPPASGSTSMSGRCSRSPAGLRRCPGLMLTGRMASVLSGQGQNMIFTVFAAAVIGRISLNGGKGSIFGALFGVILLGIISNILTLSNIETFWISATYGAIILLSLILTRLTSGQVVPERLNEVSFRASRRR